MYFLGYVGIWFVILVNGCVGVWIVGGTRYFWKRDGTMSIMFLCRSNGY